MSKEETEKTDEKASGPKEAEKSNQASKEADNFEGRVQQLLGLAKELSQELENDDLELAKAAICEARASMGDCDEALKLAEDVRPGNARWHAYTIVGKALARCKSVDEVIEIAANQKDEEDRACLYDGIARSLAEQEQVASSIEVASRIENKYNDIA